MGKRLLLFGFFICFSIILPAQDLRGDTIDIRSYKLNINLTDFTTKILHGHAVIGIKAKQNGVEGIRLDLLELTVDSVKVNATKLSYSYNDTVISIGLPSVLNTNDSATLQVFYHGKPIQPAGDFGGFYWNGPYAFNIGVSFLDDQHCYGRVWFPCFDNFTERSRYEFFVTTKTTHKAFCNGTLQDSSSTSTTNLWHWKLADEIPSYLASVAVSDYCSLEDTVQGMNGTIPIILAARAGDTTVLKNLFVNLHHAFHIQETHWGPYQWERVGFCIVPFSSGAMEHATNVAFMQLYLSALSASAETTMAHELSHHWFGDLVTCQDASEMWLNEGWASYNEYLFLEKMYSDSVYRRSVLDNHEFVLHKAHLNDASYLPVSPVPSKYTYGTTVYRKGADMIHTLRYYMGDAQFFHCMESYLSDFAFQNATTAQLRDYLSQCSGINLTDYFNDWIYSPGFAHFSFERKEVLSVLDVGFTVQMVIRQKLNNASHFYNNVPVTVSYFDAHGNRTDEIVNVSGECTSHQSQIFTQYEPIYVALDFNGKLQDAITDEWRAIPQPGVYDFGTAKMSLTVTAAPELSLVRVEHNWVRPEPLQNKVAGLHLHDKRYWTVDGMTTPGFKANARIDYDGTDVSLDAAFISNSEDSLVVLYRANNDSDWLMADSFTINTGDNSGDKKGSATIRNIQKGQYCLAIWNAQLADTTMPDVACIYNSLPEQEEYKHDFKLFPNPTAHTATLAFEPNVFVKVELYDLRGRKIEERKISAAQNSVQLNLINITAGSYLATLTTREGMRLTKKLIKE